jgi:Winged helix-turn helix
VLFSCRLRLFTLAAEIGVRPACRAMGVHHSTYYRWKGRVDRWGLEALRVRERRRPRMPKQIGPHLEQRVLAFSLAHPGCGPRRISAEPDRPVSARMLSRSCRERAQHLARWLRRPTVPKGVPRVQRVA